MRMPAIAEKMLPRERDALWVHTLFMVICILVLGAPLAMQSGPRFLILVIVYDILLLLVGWIRKDAVWLQMWSFAAVMSVLQVFPDWFLSAQLKILLFPEDGLFKIGTVSGYMAGLWTIPLFLILLTGNQVQERYSTEKVVPAVALVSLVIFGGSEQTLWVLDSWYARQVTMVGHIAIYILVPEVILGLAVWFGFQQVRDRPWPAQLPAAFIVMLLYLGAAAFFYFVVERLL